MPGNSHPLHLQKIYKYYSLPIKYYPAISSRAGAAALLWENGFGKGNTL
jgi:hypothetical protein